MNKRKVLSILLLALITVALAVSCSSNIETPVTNTEELAYVTFGNGHSRELGTSYLTEDYDNLFWFYTATKDDQYGTTGQVGLTNELPTAAVSKNNNSPIKGLSGRVGPFSQGKWIFTLYAYKEAVNAQGIVTGSPDMTNLIYKSAGVPVILKGGDVKSVPVSVTTQGNTGTLEVKDAYFEWYNNQDPSLGTIGQGGGNAKPLIKFSLVNSNGVDIVPVTATIVFNDKEDNKFSIPNNTYKYNVPVGYYTGIVSVYLDDDNSGVHNEGTPVYRQSFGVRIYGNATTYISGNMVEGVDSKVTFDVPEQEMVIFTVDEDGSRELTVPITPDGEQGNNTVVSFPSGALDTSAVHQLNVTVTPTASAEQKFQVSSIQQEDNISRTAVAGIDLTMVKVQKNADGSNKEVGVTNFNGQPVTITTYIATNLQQGSVSVKYLDGTSLKDDGISEVNYDHETGLLSFKTTHFSQYVVVSPVEALNVNTGVPYTSLATAIADAKDGQEVKVMKDVDVNPTVVVDKGITINLNGKNITGNSVRTLHFTNGSSIITGTGTISSNVSDVGSSVIRIGCGTYSTWDATTSDINISLIIDRNVKITSETCYGITVMGASNETLEVKGEISSTAPENTDYDGCAVSTNGSDKTLSTIIIHEGAKLSALNTNAIYMPSGCLIVNGGEITGRTGIYIKSGPSEINGGTITGNGTAREYQTYGNGGISTGDAFVVDNTDYPNGAPSIIVNGGTFNSVNAKSVGSYAKKDKTTNVQLPFITGFVKGGSFSPAPSGCIADGYTVSLDNSVYVVTKVDMCLDNADTSWYGDGTASVFEIGNSRQLAGLAKLVNDEQKTFSGKTVKITDDINLEGKIWIPIGQTGATQFMGTLDGDNHTIQNLNINNDSASSNCATGLFGWLNSAIVKNLTITGATVSGHHNVGVIAGYMETSGCTIENCHVQNATVSCTSVNSEANGDKCGGIVGHAGNEGVVVKNCTVSGTTTNPTTISAGRDAGQVVGAAIQANVTNCSATNVTVTKNDTSTGSNIRNEVIGRVL